VTVVGDGQIGIAEQVRPAGRSTATPRYYQDVGLPTPAGSQPGGLPRLSGRMGFSGSASSSAKALGLTLRKIQPLTQEPFLTSRSSTLGVVVRSHPSWRAFSGQAGG
jgi:hypothetical protein